MSLGVILVLIGFAMAWSGYSAGWKMDHYYELRARGKSVKEYNYHVLFRQIWWIPVIIGIIVLLVFWRG
jgi:hypothetical protein